MSVRLAAQVLSNTVSAVMAAYYGPDLSETAKFFSVVNRFFDCLNVRSLHESARPRKPDLAPYTSQNDPRFVFLQKTFLGYLDHWLGAVRARGGFTRTEQNKMFLSHQTHEGIIMT
ncbi:uncharacterized protein LOC110440757, partial [Mizuhopecten yessoensis]|uniref:uncharacterized protein LOC110440757 n=1 Tax=Mizuhopecten yessoensis TaxID=6573 RepID=UPI000B459586